MRLAPTVIPSLLLALLPAIASAEEHPDLSGEELTNELCLSCHDTISAELTAGMHAAVDQGCTSCHDPVSQKSAPYLAGSQREVCGSCHDLEEKEIQAKHGSQPVTAVPCTRCHDPHASKNKGLLHANAHAPFAEGACDACHEPAVDGKVKLVAADTKELCNACHDDLVKRFSAARTMHAVIETDGCAACHDAHATPFPSHLKEPEYTLCAACHDDVLSQDGRASVHEPVKEPGCRACHEPHASNFPARLRTDADTICLGCHDAPAIRGGSSPPQPSVEVAPGFSMPVTFLQKARQITLDARGVGHPIFNHPVRGREDPLRKGRQLGCLSCHAPHGAEGVKLLAFSTESGQGVCQKCHQM